MTMRFIPTAKRLIVDSTDGKEWVLQSELLTGLNTDLGAAAREAVRHPGVSFVVEDSQRIYR